MAEALHEMQDFVQGYRATVNAPSNVQLGQVVEEIQKRDQMGRDMEDLPRHITRGTEFGQLMMLFSPSYWMINATQPYMVTLPWLGARYGWGSAAAALAGMQKMIISPLLKVSASSFGGLKALYSKAAAEKAFNVLDDVKAQIKSNTDTETGTRYISMLEALRRESVIDLSWIAELRDIAEGRDMSLWQKVLDMSRVMAHLTEVNNRIATALAAYELRYADALDTMRKANVQLEEPKSEQEVLDAAHEWAIEFAKEAVSKTQFDYSSGNKPRLFSARGPVGKYAPWLFQFMQWPQHMYALLIENYRRAFISKKMTPQQRSEARKALAGLFATHLAAGGLIGATLQPIKWAVGLAMAMLDDDDDWTLPNALSGENWDRLIMEAAASLFGNEIGLAVSRGLPNLIGTDMSDRMSLGSLYFLDLKTDTAESTIGSLVEGFGGPMVTLAGNVFRAGAAMKDGEYARAFEYMLPKGGRDLVRLWRYADEGLVNATGDAAIKELHPWQLFLQGLGFQPSAISRFYTRQAVIKDTQNAIEARRERIVRDFRRAQTPADRRRVLAAAADFSREHPEMRITRSQLLQAQASKIAREESFERFGAALRGQQRVYADSAWYLE